MNNVLFIMKPKLAKSNLKLLAKQLAGELHYDNLYKSIYATDASVYRKLPLAVCFPKHSKDLQTLLQFAQSHKIALHPRAAGTSLAGQCVGSGIVVDCSKHFTKILKFSKENRTVTVEPGVIRDVLNLFLKPHGLFFSPNTSTSNRCTIGGMVGNNSSGTTSIKYGVTRDKVIALTTILTNGSTVQFKALSKKEFMQKTKLNSLEGKIYATIYKSLANPETQKHILNVFPKSNIHRRNTGYAIDSLVKTNVFSNKYTTAINLSTLLCGSEGTLAFTTAITLQLDVLPPVESSIIVAHYTSITDCLHSVQTVMQHDLYTCEMLDNTILELTKHNKNQEKNRFFIQGNPTAILFCEVRATSKRELQSKTEAVIATLERENLSYANVTLTENAIHQAMELRKAGLGLLGNLIGDKKAVACIEDTAVALEDLPNYIEEFTSIMQKYQQKAVYYAHAGAGELHLRPILNLKKQEDVVLFKKIIAAVAALVKKYNGSFSGEHGDGIVRSSFIPFLLGEENYAILKQLKQAFDKHHLLNPNKIVSAIALDKNLRYQPNREEPQIDTFLNFSNSGGILREAEKCNGSGDCRKLAIFGGTMCPSFRATQNEKDTTRARANALREFLTHSNKKNKFNHTELKQVFDLCLSCKACASECPSSVDVATLKAEFLYQYQKENKITFTTSFFANSTKWYARASRFSRLANTIISNSISSSILKKILGIAAKRSLPKITKGRVEDFFKQSKRITAPHKTPIKTVYLFVDEFSKYLDSNLVSDAITVLEALNYKVNYIPHVESGRSFLSKGFLEEAKTIANKNIEIFKPLITKQTPLLGIEPSAILTFKDEYIKLAKQPEKAKKLAANVFLIEDFLQQELQAGNIKASSFTSDAKNIKVHAHCYQKALANSQATIDILNLPINYKAQQIVSGCCGMAGSFGYEKKHYAISMQIGEQTLFPAVRNAAKTTIIAANGTSCRHQIKDGTQKIAFHPITILKNALL